MILEEYISRSSELGQCLIHLRSFFIEKINNFRGEMLNNDSLLILQVLTEKNDEGNMISNSTLFSDKRNDQQLFPFDKNSNLRTHI